MLTEVFYNKLFYDAVVGILEVDCLLRRLALLAFADTPCYVEHQAVAVVLAVADGVLVEVAIEYIRFICTVFLFLMQRCDFLLASPKG